MIRIVTDSGADIPVSEAKARGIDVVSLTIHFEDKVYTQEEDTDFSHFYALLKTAKKLPKTSQPSPEDFAKVYRDAESKGDSVVVLCLSSGLSGTYQSATLGKEMVPGVPVHVVDTKSVIMGQRILVEHALRLREEGTSAEAIAAEITSLRGRMTVFGIVDTLTYLFKGGRLSRTSAIAGTLLHIKPLVAIENEKGTIVSVGKGRNFQAAVSYFADGPAYDPAFPVYFGHAGPDDICAKVREHVLERMPIADNAVFPIGSMIGTHVGPGCVAMAFMRKE